MIKSLNKAYQTDSMYYWCNAEGEVNYPGSGFSTGDSERLPAAVKELYEHYQFSTGCDANLYNRRKRVQLEHKNRRRGKRSAALQRN